jgi:GNAT superfamily N-acetyltransferase
LLFNTDHVLILPFQPADQKEVKDLILAGLAEYWGSLDPSCNPDLDDITRTYHQAVFLVARLDDRLVSTGALLPHSPRIAKIVRMSVLKSCRRRGIGRQILNRLLDYARQSGYKQVVLETTASWQGAIEFYLSNGFRVTHHKNDNIHFHLDLSNPHNTVDAIDGQSAEA